MGNKIEGLPKANCVVDAQLYFLKPSTSNPYYLGMHFMSANNKTLKCGLVMPISAIDGCSAEHWEEIRIIIKEALNETDFLVELVSDSNEIGIIQKRIIQNIYDNDIVICDVSAKNPNVMFELGMRLAFDKPAIIIKDDKTNYSFDTASIEHIEYPRDLHYHSIQIFKSKLKEKVAATYEASKRPEYTTFLKNFGSFVVAKIDEKNVGANEFAIEAILDLRREMQALNKAVRQPSERATRTTKIGDLLNEMSSNETDIEEKFIYDYLAENGSKISAQELLNTESNTFGEMVSSYFSSRNRNTHWTPAKISIAKRNLASAVSRVLL